MSDGLSRFESTPTSSVEASKMRSYASGASAPKAAGGAVRRRRSCGGLRPPVVRRRSLVLAGLALALVACGGKRDFFARPPHLENVVDPRTILSFDTLYGANCAGCHGARGQGGLAIGLASPSYLAIVSDATVRAVIAEGRAKTAMPAFAMSAGGTLGNAQVDALAAGIRAWAPPGSQQDPRGAVCQASASGDAGRGARVFARNCGSCHGADGHGNDKVGSVVDESFVALVSDAHLCATVLAGRPDLGCLRARRAGETPMSEEEISDTVAWLSSHRQRSSREPYRSAQTEARKP